MRDRKEEPHTKMWGKIRTIFFRKEDNFCIPVYFLAIILYYLHAFLRAQNVRRFLGHPGDGSTTTCFGAKFGHLVLGKPVPFVLCCFLFFAAGVGR